MFFIIGENIMKKFIFVSVSLMMLYATGFAANNAVTSDDDNPKLRQYYSAKLGFYSPSDGLNNGLLVGVDGITEFTRYNFFLAGALDAYLKQSIDIFHDPKPDIKSQQMILLPLHMNVGYKIFDIDDANTRGYVGIGGGYYFYFYSLQYQQNSGILGTGPTVSDSKNSGDLFGSIFARIVIGKVFVEPRYYFASKSEENISSYSFTVNPTGFSISIGFQE